MNPITVYMLQVVNYFQGFLDVQDKFQTQSGDK